MPLGKEKKPILEQVILNLRKAGVKDFIITVSHLGYQIKNYFGDGKRFGVKIEYAEEKKPLGTAGCLVPLKEKVGNETFLLVAGDNLTSMNMKKFIQAHKKNAKKGAILTIALAEASLPVEYGVVETKDSIVTGFKEKPTLKYNVATLIMCLEPAIFKYIPKGFSNITDHVFPRLLASREKIYGHKFKDFWADIGKLEEYNKMNSELHL